MAEPLALLLVSGDYERVHYGFVLAAGAVAIDAPVVVFATGRAIHGLCADWSGLSRADTDVETRARGVAGLAELRDAVVSLGGRLLACDAGLRLAGIAPDRLLPGVEVSGVADFLGSAWRRVISL